MSKISVSYLFNTDCVSAAFESLTALSILFVKTGKPFLSARSLNCSNAAGLLTSAGIRNGFLPFFFRKPASLTVVVVFPAPWRPTSIITEGVLSSLNGSGLPRSSIIFSYTIFSIISEGVKLFRTFSPIASASTIFINSLATSTFTSASMRARLTSFSPSRTLSGVSLPFLPKFLMIF